MVDEPADRGSWPLDLVDLQAEIDEIEGAEDPEVIKEHSPELEEVLRGASRGATQGASRTTSRTTSTDTLNGTPESAAPHIEQTSILSKITPREESESDATAYDSEDAYQDTLEVDAESEFDESADEFDEDF